LDVSRGKWDEDRGVRKGDVYKQCDVNKRDAVAASADRHDLKHGRHKHEKDMYDQHDRDEHRRHVHDESLDRSSCDDKRDAVAASTDNRDCKDKHQIREKEKYNKGDIDESSDRSTSRSERRKNERHDIDRHDQDVQDRSDQLDRYDHTPPERYDSRRSSSPDRYDSRRSKHAKRRSSSTKKAHKSHRSPEVQMFRGDSSSNWDTFIHQFTRIAKRRGWSDRKKSRHLLDYLEDEALQYAENLHGCDYKKVKKKMASHFRYLDDQRSNNGGSNRIRSPPATQADIHKLTSTMTQVFTKISDVGRHRRSPSPSPQRLLKMQCYSCRDYGHLARDCTQRSPVTRRTEGDKQRCTQSPRKWSQKSLNY
jgi:hypothetical protein